MIWKKISSEFEECTDGGQRTLSIDAWITNDENEEGKVIAKVSRSKKGEVMVEYLDERAMIDSSAQEIIKNRMKELKECKEAPVLENPKNVLLHNLVIESITLLDGKTLDERVQYKVGRDVLKLVGAGIGFPFFVFYNETRGWQTYPVEQIHEDEERMVLTDNISVYTFKKIRTAI